MRKMSELFASTRARTLGAAVAAASVAAIIIAVAPGTTPEALSQTPPGSTVPPIGEGLNQLLAAIFEFIRRLFAGLGFPFEGF